MAQDKRSHPALGHHTPDCWDPFGVRLTLPEHYLMWGVLQRAMFDRIANCEVSKQDRRSAKRYFEDRADEREGLFSFHSIAEHLAPYGEVEAFKAGVLKFLSDALHEKVIGASRPKGSGMKVKAS